MRKSQYKALVLTLIEVLIILWCTIGFTESFPLPNIIDAPHNKDDNIPPVLAGVPRPLLDGDSKMIIYDLAATITDEGFDAMESINIGYLWYPLLGNLFPFW